MLLKRRQDLLMVLFVLLNVVTGKQFFFFSYPDTIFIKLHCFMTLVLSYFSSGTDVLFDFVHIIVCPWKKI